MTDPTGRQPADPQAEAPQPEEHPGRPTDVTPQHPLAEIPRPFTREAMNALERQIKDGILRMGSMVAESHLAAIAALEEHDETAASAIIRGDDRLNEELELVSNLVTQTIVKEQPVARDLRFLMALDHVAYELERMGDYAGSVAKQARKLAPRAPLPPQNRLAELGRMVVQQVRDILTVVVEVDEARAREIAGRDDDVDELYHAIFDETLEAMRQDPDNVDGGARILFAAHYLERTGDRVTNIAEDIVFLATGEVEDLNQ
ncbi:MAG: phosphate signaling complex protein PhoU [Candidatus Limnocylindrales bacterium]